jgi:hypothetical protein
VNEKDEENHQNKLSNCFSSNCNVSSSSTTSATSSSCLSDALNRTTNNQLDAFKHGITNLKEKLRNFSPSIDLNEIEKDTKLTNTESMPNLNEHGYHESHFKTHGDNTKENENRSSKFKSLNHNQQLKKDVIIKKLLKTIDLMNQELSIRK